MVLAKSAKQYNPGIKMIICLLEREIPEEIKSFPYFDKIVLAKDLGFENFERHIFKHLLVEAATSVKGQLFKFLMKTFDAEDKFIYLDPDIKVMGPFVELDRLLGDHEIVLTPHLCEPEETVFDIKHNECCALQHGVFNLGFLAVRRGREAERFIDWWCRRLELFCYDDKENGLFTDQKWIDLAPGFFQIYILRHPGYNFAPWNYSKRNITKADDNEYLVNGEPLRFIHFSGFDSGANESVMQTYKPDKTEPLHQLLREYEVESTEMYGKFDERPWSYAYFDSGELIERQTRLVFREEEVLQHTYPDPYCYSNQTFLDTDKKVDSTEWERLIQLQFNGINLNPSYLKTFRFNICFMKNIYEKREIRYLIWGAGTSGSITKKIMEHILPKFKLVGVIDKYKRGKFENLEITEPVMIDLLKFDYVMIATSPGKSEVEILLQKKGFIKYQDYCFGYGVI